MAALAVLAVLRGTGSTLGAAFLVGFVADSEAAELAIASRQASKQSFMSGEDECWCARRHVGDAVQPATA